MSKCFAQPPQITYMYELILQTWQIINNKSIDRPIYEMSHLAALVIRSRSLHPNNSQELQVRW